MGQPRLPTPRHCRLADHVRRQRGQPQPGGLRRARVRRRCRPDPRTVRHPRTDPRRRRHLLHLTTRVSAGVYVTVTSCDLRTGITHYHARYRRHGRPATRRPRVCSRTSRACGPPAKASAPKRLTGSTRPAGRRRRGDRAPRSRGRSRARLNAHPPPGLLFAPRGRPRLTRRLPPGDRHDRTAPAPAPGPEHPDRVNSPPPGTLRWTASPPSSPTPSTQHPGEPRRGRAALYVPDLYVTFCQVEVIDEPEPTTAERTLADSRTCPASCGPTASANNCPAAGRTASATPTSIAAPVTGPVMAPAGHP